IIEQVIKSGNFEKVTLGIKGIDVTTFESSTGTDLAADEGVYIVEVVSDTPAQKSGIQAGDVIVKVGNAETPTMTDLNKVLYKYKSGQSTKVTVNRSGKEVTVDIKF
ncbi:PDZ domain-containing protein, partial [Romboutsia timonensis]|uniref:PDZ domain-containing protein n=1 Tax=Romboutsia timonensis TaxID=1776391 RepID=UPI002A7F0906